MTLAALKVKHEQFCSALKTTCIGTWGYNSDLSVMRGCIKAYIMMLWCVLMLNIQFDEQEQEVILSGLYWKIINFQMTSREL